MTINNITVRMGNHEDSTVINNIELQAASLFPDELLPKALYDKTLSLYEIESAIQEQQLWIAEIDQKQVGFALKRNYCGFRCKNCDEINVRTKEIVTWITAT
ncbi:hypothetical protein BB987_02770 [Photorhabdus temperata]|uniref:Uncharacterized protein n=2 Tax=Photorhabdus khanii TaxID=1004150 RepID=W3V523_9GAMM|nr:hypothetical protein [Photorhabdus khanii]ETS30903.1 hypothetical protein PTE_02849 [Photorhabdus khanii NC19]MQL47385.1 hypothetical protein [Photorhabdus khanii]OHV49107.1 hypothetical protein BB987_02770 [Photorhabdus temperata]